MSRSQSFLDYREQLIHLYTKRIDGARENAKMDFSADGGDVFYEEVLGLICEAMGEIYLSFPGMKFFQNCGDGEWRESFKKNFHKLFLDRQKNAVGVEDKPSTFFNRYDLLGSVNGADLCYREGFALAFLHMLNCAKEQLQKRDLQISPQRFIELFCELNELAVANISSSLEYKVGLKTGHMSSFANSCNKARALEQFGSMQAYFNPKNVYELSIFGDDFDHSLAAKFLLQNFREKIAHGENVAQALSELTDELGSNIHLCCDGNGRAAILYSWFEAILHNTVPPIGIYPFFYDEELASEGQRWAESFMENPKINALTTDQLIQFNRVKRAASEESKRDLILFSFLGEIFKKGGLEFFYQVPPPQDEKLFINKRNLSGELVMTIESIERENSQAVSISYLKAALAEKADELRMTHQELLYPKIALFFMRQINVVQKSGEVISDLDYQLIGKIIESKLHYELESEAEIGEFEGYANEFGKEIKIRSAKARRLQPQLQTAMI